MINKLFNGIMETQCLQYDTGSLSDLEMIAKMTDKINEMIDYLANFGSPYESTLNDIKAKLELLQKTKYDSDLIKTNNQLYGSDFRGTWNGFSTSDLLKQGTINNAQVVKNTKELLEKVCFCETIEDLNNIHVDIKPTVQNTINLLPNYFTTLTNNELNAANGNLVTSSEYKTTDYIEISNLKLYTTDVKDNVICFYYKDDQGNYVYISSMSGKTPNDIIDPPSNAEYMRVSGKDWSKLDTYYFKEFLPSFGSIVFVGGYYKFGDGGHHYRFISNVKLNDLAIELNNGMYANLMYDNVINLAWLGAKNCAKYNVIYDIKPLIEKIMNLDENNYVMKTDILIPHGYYGLSDHTFFQHGLHITGASVMPFYLNTTVGYGVGTVLFPIDNGQIGTLSIGSKTKAIRGIDIRNLNIITSSFKIQDGIFTSDDRNGALKGLDIKSSVYGRIEDIVINGKNPNCEFAWAFNGCETYIRNIMVRQCLPRGGNGKFGASIYTEVRNTKLGASGMRCENISFEGVGVPWLKCQGVDFHVQGINGEYGSFLLEDNTVEVDDWELLTQEQKDNAIHECLIDINALTLGVIISDVTIQKLGRVFKTTTTDVNGQSIEEIHVIDNLISNTNEWGSQAFFQLNHVLLQEVRKDFYWIHDDCRTNVNADGDFGNQPVYSVSNLVNDRYEGRFFLKDNVRLIKDGNGNIPKLSNGVGYNDTCQKWFQGRLTPEDSMLSHCVRWDNELQQNYMSFVKNKPGFEMTMGIFKIDEKIQGNFKVNICHFGNTNDTILHFILIDRDGNEKDIIMTLPKTQTLTNRIVTTFDLNVPVGFYKQLKLKVEYPASGNPPKDVAVYWIDIIKQYS